MKRVLQVVDNKTIFSINFKLMSNCQCVMLCLSDQTRTNHLYLLAKIPGEIAREGEGP